MLASIVEIDALLETVLASTVAGVGMTATFSAMIFGLVRFADLRREERPLAAFAAGLIAILALVAAAGGIVLGIVVMTSK